MKEKGKIMIHLKNDSHEYISSVYYVLELKSNILSIGQLLEKSYIIYIENSTLTLRNKNKKLIAKIQILKHGVFAINIKIDQEMLSSMFERPHMALAFVVWALEF